MKLARNLAPIVLLAFLLSTAAFARDKQEGTFSLDQATRLGSTELQAGHYKAEWTQQTGNTVKVEILKNGRQVATATGTIKELQQPSEYSAVTTKTLSSNEKMVEEIDFSGHREALVFGG